MSVAVDNTGQSVGGVSVSSLTITSFVVGAGSNRCIYLGVSQWNNPDLAPTGATFNGTENFVLHDAIAFVESGAGTRRVTIFKLVNPTVTTANIVVSWASAVTEAVCGATSWNGVHQTTPFGTAVKSNNGAGSPATTDSISIPNASGDVVHDTVAWDGPTGAAVGTANQTSRWKNTAAANSTEGDGQSAGGTGTNITCTWSTETNGFFAHIGVAIQQAASAVAGAGISGSRRNPVRRSPRDRANFWAGQIFAVAPSSSSNPVAFAAQGAGGPLGSASLSVLRAIAAVGLAASIAVAGLGVRRAESARGVAGESAKAGLGVNRDVRAQGVAGSIAKAGLGVNRAVAARGVAAPVGQASMGISRALSARGVAGSLSQAGIIIGKAMPARGVAGSVGRAALSASRALAVQGVASVTGRAGLSATRSLASQGKAGPVGKAGLSANRAVGAKGSAGSAGTASLGVGRALSAKGVAGSTARAGVVSGAAQEIFSYTGHLIISPLWDGVVDIAPMLEGDVIVATALEGVVSIAPQLDGSVQVSPLLQGDVIVEPS